MKTELLLATGEDSCQGMVLEHRVPSTPESASDDSFEVPIPLATEMAVALKASTRFARSLALELMPGVGTWITLRERDLVIVGRNWMEVHDLARRWQRADMAVRHQGLRTVEAGTASNLLSGAAERASEYMESLGYERTTGGKWGIPVSVGVETISLLDGPLSWLRKLWRDARFEVVLEPSSLVIHTWVYDYSMAVADEIKAIDGFTSGTVARSPTGFGAIEFLLGNPERIGILCRADFRALLLKATRTGDYRHANAAYLQGGLLTRVKLDPHTGRAKGGFQWMSPGGWSAP